MAELVGVINEGIPAVVLFNQRRTDSHTTLMAGELEELPKLLRRVYKATKGKYLSTDSEGFFLRSSSQMLFVTNDTFLEARDVPPKEPALKPKPVS